MTHDDIMHMANQAAGQSWGTEEHLVRLAALVAAAEREACAQICDSYAQADHANFADSCAEEIRARGEQ